jgi:hypothetical protein
MRARGFAAVDAEFAGYRLLAVACGVPGSYRLFQERTRRWHTLARHRQVGHALADAFQLAGGAIASARAESTAT